MKDFQGFCLLFFRVLHDASSSRVQLFVRIPSCDVKMLGVHYVCMESANDSYVRSECASISDESMGLAEGKVGSGCPGGAKKTCDATEDGVSGTAFFYFDDAASATCEELLSDEEEDDYGFTPDDDEYYMKALKKAAKK